MHHLTCGSKDNDGTVPFPNMILVNGVILLPIKRQKKLYDIMTAYSEFSKEIVVFTTEVFLS